MDVTIFRHQNDPGYWESYLDRALHRHLPMVPRTSRIVEHDWESTSKIGFEYLQLMQAAIPPELGLDLSLKTHESMGYGFYFNIYFRAGSYYQGSAGLYTILPAVAIHERMVLVPNRIREDLTRLGLPSDIPLFKDSHFGPLAVDFNNVQEVENAVMTVCKDVEAEVTRELRAYASRLGSDELDVAEAARMIGVDLTYLQGVLRDEEATLRPFYQRITCRCQPTELACGRFTRLNLIIENHSDRAINDLIIKINGPIKVLPGRPRATVEPGSSCVVPVSILPEQPGEFPIEIRYFRPEDQPFSTWLPVQYIWLQCEEPSLPQSRVPDGGRPPVRSQ